MKIFVSCLLLVIIEITYGLLEKDKLVLLPTNANYDTASKLCKEKNLNLVKIEDSESNKIVFDFAKEKGVNHYWIDANDKKMENDFVHNDGNKVVYRNWNTAQPDNSNNEDCVHGMVEANGKWNDLNCDKSLSVICYPFKGCYH